MGKLICILLGAGAPMRGAQHAGLQNLQLGCSSIERLLTMYHGCCDDMIFVGGYEIDVLINRYPRMFFINNQEWKKTGSVFSLSLVNIDPEATYLVSYTDVVYTQRVLDNVLISEKPISIAIDTRPCARYEGRIVSPSSGMMLKKENMFSVADTGGHCFEGVVEFAGVMKISGAVLAELFAEQSKLPEDASRWHLHQLIAYCNSIGYSIDIVDATDHWAELNAPQDIANFSLASKAKTLERLNGTIKKSVILPQCSFTVTKWEENFKSIVDEILQKFSGSRLAIRSSSTLEDSWDSSQAGAFDSLLDVEVTEDKVYEAVTTVIASYPNADPFNEVLVQPFLQDITVAGVIFTRTLNNGAPYYVINYDESGACDGVTSGCGKALKTTIIHHSVSHPPDFISDKIHELPDAVKEIVKLCGYDSLDIEFAKTRGNELYILQVRPIAVDHSTWKVDDDEVDGVLQHGKEIFQGLQSNNPVLFGSRSILGNMPDWNPAEIIGVAPKNLAYSLYRELITDGIWAQQRAEFGYKDVRGTPLIVQVAGRPYVDTRASFSSFIPESVSPSLAHKLVDAYLNRLEAFPYLHDKVEFEIALTCLAPDFDEKSQWLLDEGFTRNELVELKRGLFAINRSVSHILQRSQESIDTLEEKLEIVSASDLTPLRKAFQLLYLCKEYGTLAFSHLARVGFVAVTLLRAFVQKKVITQQELDVYFSSLETVAKRFSCDRKQYESGAISLASLVDSYGHLRPGTYDLCSPCYASNPEFYFTGVAKSNESYLDSDQLASFFTKVAQYLETNAEELGLPLSVEETFEMFRNGIEGREYSKYIFTKCLSRALESIAEFGEGIGVSRSDLAHLSISEMKSVLVGQCGIDVPAWLMARAHQAKETYRVTRAVELPFLIVSADDICSFELIKEQPNYISSKACIAPSVCLEEGEPPVDIAGKIVCIKRADPGYDWLFNHDIAGLITCFGGANSHMAIRAAERQLPAAIGVGEVLFNELSAEARLQLDCAGRTIQAV